MSLDNDTRPKNRLRPEHVAWIDAVVVPAILSRGWKLFEGDLDLNVVVWRTPSRRPDAFDDWVVVFCGQRGAWEGCILRATADPGLQALRDKKHPLGVAVISEQQTRGGWSIGNHKLGKPDAYPAFRQNGTIYVDRDPDGDDMLDPSELRVRGSGINLHCADNNPFLAPSRWRPGKSVGRWSEGCVVIADGYEYVTIFWPWVLASAEKFGPNFTATVINGPNPTWSP